MHASNQIGTTTPRLAIAIGAALLYAACAAGAQSWPVKSIRLVAPLAPGSSSNDILGRAVAQRLGEALGQSIVMDYRPGTAGNLGSSIAARAAPDGYTLLLGYTSATMISPIVYPNSGYDPDTDLVPIVRLAVVPWVIVAHPSVQATTVKELITLAMARPSQLNYASAGSGGLPHLAGELFKMSAKVDIVHVPYKGGALAVNDLVGGHVQLYFTGITGVAPFIRAGRLRGIAVATMRRSPLMPALPTVEESGLPGYDVVSAVGLLAPGKTPRTIVQRLYDETVRVVNAPNMTSFIVSQGAEPALMDPAQFGAYIRAELSKWAHVVKVANIKPD